MRSSLGAPHSSERLQRYAFFAVPPNNLTIIFKKSYSVCSTWPYEPYESYGSYESYKTYKSYKTHKTHNSHFTLC
jgi:hypothetical protein